MAAVAHAGALTAFVGGAAADQMPGGEPQAAAAATPDPSIEAGSSAAPPLEVTVAGTSVASTAGSAHIISGRKLERFAYDDPHAVLTAVPGVYARGEDGMGLRPNIGLRGVNPDRSKKVTLMEDGVLLAPAPYSAPAAYYFPMMGRAASLRVIKGPGAISYGPQTVGGAIDIVTRSIPSSLSAMAELGAGQYGYGKFHGYAGSGDEHVGFLVEGVHLRSDGFKELPNGAGTGFYRNEWMFKGSYVVDPSAAVRNELQLKAVYSDEVSNETYMGLTDADLRATPLRRYGASQLDQMKNHRTALTLTHSYEPAPNLSITTTAYRHDFSRVWRKVNAFRGADIFSVLGKPDDPRNAVYAAILRGEADTATPNETLLIGPNEREFVSQGVAVVVRYQPVTGAFTHRVEYGLRVHNDRVERRHSESGFRMLGGELVPEGGPTVVTTFNEAETTAIALHATDAISYERLTVTPGVRIESIRGAAKDRAARTAQVRSTQVVLPGVGAFYGLTNGLRVLAGAYRGFSPAPPESAHGVPPELSVNYEAGARWVGGRSRAEVIGFYNDYQNLTDTCTLSSGCVEQNLDRQFGAGKARIYGVEVYADHTFALGAVKLPVAVSYTQTKAQFQSTFQSEDPIFGRVVAGDEVPYVPRHEANGSVGVDLERAALHVNVSHVSAMRESAGRGPLRDVLATEASTVVDVSARYRFTDTMTLQANLRNLFNEQAIVAHRPFGARPNAPRWIQLGIKVAF